MDIFDCTVKTTMDNRTAEVVVRTAQAIVKAGMQ